MLILNEMLFHIGWREGGGEVDNNSGNVDVFKFTNFPVPPIMTAPVVGWGV